MANLVSRGLAVAGRIFWESTKVIAGVDENDNIAVIKVGTDGTLATSVTSSKSITEVVGSHNTTTTKELIAAGAAGIKHKVHSITFSTLVDASCLVQLTDGSAGTVIYEIELQSSIVPGVALASAVIPYCETTAATALHLKLGAAQKVTYSITDVSEA